MIGVGRVQTSDVVLVVALAFDVGIAFADSITNLSRSIVFSLQLLWEELISLSVVL